MSRSFACIAALAACTWTSSARADDDDDAPKRRPLTEPIFSETVTDLDADEAGEFEVEVNVSNFRALRGGAYDRQTSLELEWLATRRLGFRLEPSYALSRDSSQYRAVQDVSLTGGVSWKLLHDFEHDFHLQWELLFRLPWDETATVQPGDPALPLAIDLRGGWRTGLLTTRFGVGMGNGGDPEHVPLRGSIAVLLPFEKTERLGFFGVEMDADGGRRNPVVLALNVVPDLTGTGLPLRLGLAVPWGVGGRDTEPSLGVFLRIFIVSDREATYGRTGK